MFKNFNKLEKSWIYYDIGNSAFTMMVSTIIPIWFNTLAAVIPNTLHSGHMQQVLRQFLLQSSVQSLDPLRITKTSRSQCLCLYYLLV